MHDGRTAHSAFKVPLDVTANSPPDLDPKSERGIRIANAQVLILDEISMLHKQVLSFIDRQVRSVCPVDKRHLPFGGKTVLLSGDFKQLTPVVIGSNRHG
jgi:ATP-dependent DNA helicase PIF1